MEYSQLVDLLGDSAGTEPMYYFNTLLGLSDP